MRAAEAKEARKAKKRENKKEKELHSTLMLLLLAYSTAAYSAVSCELRCHGGCIIINYKMFYALSQ